MGNSNSHNSDTQPTTIFAVVDCNNFFVSCERVFRPDLKDKPVIVLSNNDGCAVARSNEVKALGIPMGAPIFKYESLVYKHNITLFSSNFTLYGDISNRVMRILKNSFPSVEVYSIDEAFLDLSSFQIKDIDNHCRKIKNQIEHWTGIPVSIGIGTTKTLAKAASEIAKKNPEFVGIVNLVANKDIDNLLNKVEVGDVWGIGRSYSKFLINKGILTAKDLKDTALYWIRKNLKVLGEKTVLELNGVSCHKIRIQTATAKSIVVSRSFEKEISRLEDLRGPIARHIAEGSRRLREKNMKTKNLNIYLLINRFHPERKEPSLFGSKELLIPTSHTPELTKHAMNMLNKIYKPYLYKKVGISFTKLIPNDSYQYNFFEKDKNISQKNISFMKTIDDINKTWGRGTIRIAEEGTNQRWTPKSEERSPRYTTRWQELFEIKV